jgi:RimJ/RimL family protein N-acetyltransferase
MIRTERLVLRRWQESDSEPFAVINADLEVMEHFPSPLTRAESDAYIERVESEFERRGFGLWAVTAGEQLIGFTGLSVPSFEAHFTPTVEIGWRFARSSWGQGYGSEAARAALAYGFTEAGLAEIVSFTALVNKRSEALMRRIGMTHDPADDFDHPRLPEGDRLRRHVLYRLTADRWRGSN